MKYARLVIEKTKIPISIKEFTEERNKLNVGKYLSRIISCTVIVTRDSILINYFSP